MYTRRRLLSLPRHARLAPGGLAAAPSSRRFSLPPARPPPQVLVMASSVVRAQPMLAAILFGQAAVVLGLSSNSVLARDDSVASAATSEHADAKVTGVRRIEMVQ